MFNVNDNDPFLYIKSYIKCRCVEILLKSGIDPDIAIGQTTPLHLAAEGGHAEASLDL